MKPERKMWKKPIRISRLPSFGLSSASDFKFDQIPTIFSGYTAGTEDSSASSSSEISDDDSRSFSKSSDVNDEISQASSGSMKRGANLKKMKSMKILRRQSTRKLSGGGIQMRQRLKKMRSMKRLTSSSRQLLRTDLDSISRLDHNSDIVLLQPHYLKPTSSSASKNVEKIQKNLGSNLVSTLKRTSSLRYNGLLKATCSSAMKGSKNSNDVSNGKVCTYRYCSLHGRRHSHADNVTVPSLKRFVSMRRKFLKRQKSVNRRLILLKRTLSRKRGPLASQIATDQEGRQVDGIADVESNQDVFEEHVSSSDNLENDSDSMDGEESSLAIVDDLDGDTDKYLKRKTDVWHRICKQIVTGLDHDNQNAGVIKSEEVKDDDDEVCRENLSNLQESSGEKRKEDDKNAENVWSDTVMLVQQAFDEILAEITDDSSESDDDSITSEKTSEVNLEKEEAESSNFSDSDSSDMEPIEASDTHLSVISPTIRMREESDQRGPKNWSYLKKVILLKRFLKSFDRRDGANKLPTEGESKETETMQRLRGKLIGERKTGEEWMLDHALRQVISTLAPSQKRKVKHLVKAFESLNPMDDTRGHDLGMTSRPEASPVHPNPDNAENETMNLQTNLTENRDINLQEVLDSKTEEPKEDLPGEELSSETPSLSIGNKSDLISFIEEEKTGDSESKTEDEKQNLSTWRNLIHKHMVMRERKLEESDENTEESSEIDHMKYDGDAVKSFQQAFEKILSEIPEENVSESSNSLKEDQGTFRSWNSLKKVILLKRFVKSLENVKVLNPRKLRNPPVESNMKAENVFLRHLTTEQRSDRDELMLDYALRQAISRLAPIQRKKVELLVQAFDTVLDGNQQIQKSCPRNDETAKVAEDCGVNRDEERKTREFSRIEVHEKDFREELSDNTPRESRNLPPLINDVKQKEKDSRLWKLIYKHMATDKEGTEPANEIKTVASVEDLQVDARRNGTVTLVKEALEKILSEIPDNSSDDQSMDSDITTEQEVTERNSKERQISFKSSEKRVKGWNNVKKVILLKRFVSDLGSMTRLSPKTPRILPGESDLEGEKINLRHLPMGGRRNSEEWMLDYALQQAISTLAPSQKRKVSLLAQAFDTISLQDIGSCSSPSVATSRNISRQSSTSSLVHIENETCSETGETKRFEKARDITENWLEGNAEITRTRLRNLQEDHKETKPCGISVLEKEQCSSLWRLLCEQMESGDADNRKSQTLPEETRKEEEVKEETEVENEGEKMELYQTEAVELLGEVIDGISLEENQKEKVQGDGNLSSRQKIKSEKIPQVRNRWSNLKRVILLRRFVKALDNVRKFNPREPRFLLRNPDAEAEAEKVNLRHQETQNKRNDEEWMVDNALQGVVSKLTPARRLKVQLLVQAFESLSATGN